MSDFLIGLHPSSIWLLVGAILIILEIVLFPGIGFLFAGSGWELLA